MRRNLLQPVRGYVAYDPTQHGTRRSFISRKDGAGFFVGVLTDSEQQRLGHLPVQADCERQPGVSSAELEHFVEEFDQAEWWVGRKTGFTQCLS